MVVMCLLPFSIVDNNNMRRFFSFAGICRNTLTKYVHKLVLTVEHKISLTLPGKFALIFDGWSCGSTHYVAVYASYPSESAYGYSTALLSFGPV